MSLRDLLNFLWVTLKIIWRPRGKTSGMMPSRLLNTRSLEEYLTTHKPYGSSRIEAFTATVTNVQPTFETIQMWLQNIHFLDWSFLFSSSLELGYYTLTLYCRVPDSDIRHTGQTKLPLVWTIQSVTMNELPTKEMLIYACYKLILARVEHEVGELFTVGDVQPFHPHRAPLCNDMFPPIDLTNQFQLAT